MFPLIDTHIHLDNPAYEKDLKKILNNAKKSGVKVIITLGVHHEINKKILEFKKIDPIIKIGMGIYPLDALNVKVDKFDNADSYRKDTLVNFDDTLTFIEQNKNNIICIGEVGMDFKYSTDKENQIINFKKIIELSKKLNKPMSIHTRNAEEEVINLLEESGVNKKLVVLHCFSGKKKLIQKAVKLGYNFSIPASITRNQHFQLIAELAPVSQLLTETDGPYMAPERDMERSEPQHVLYTINKIAEIKKMTPEEVANIIFMNYQRIYL